MRRATTNRLMGAAILIAVLPVLLTVGCGLMLRMSGYRPPWFNHRVHVVEKGMDCEDCHAGAKSEALAGMPEGDTCLACHEEIDAKKAPEMRSTAFFPEGKPTWTNLAEQSPEIIFSHASHAAKEIPCEACHPGTRESTKVPTERPMRMEQCIDCHAEKGAPTACETCHRVIRQDVPPRDHRFSWMEIHGQVARGGDGRTDRDRCNLCHTQADCVHCHEEVPPRDHTGYFRNRGHGALAELNRDRCQACHRVDFCDRCHNSRFGVATPKPSWHTPFMNCRQCHYPGHLLPHGDSGADCNRCHK